MVRYIRWQSNTLGPPAMHGFITALLKTLYCMLQRIVGSAEWVQGERERERERERDASGGWFGVSVTMTAKQIPGSQPPPLAAPTENGSLSWAPFPCALQVRWETTLTLLRLTFPCCSSIEAAAVHFLVLHVGSLLLLLLLLLRLFFLLEHQRHWKIVSSALKPSFHLRRMGLGPSSRSPPVPQGPQRLQLESSKRKQKNLGIFGLKIV
jgi:hypothetical protein